MTASTASVSLLQGEVGLVVLFWVLRGVFCSFFWEGVCLLLGSRGFWFWIFFLVPLPADTIVLIIFSSHSCIWLSLLTLCPHISGSLGSIRDHLSAFPSSLYIGSNLYQNSHWAPATLVLSSQEVCRGYAQPLSSPMLVHASPLMLHKTIPFSKTEAWWELGLLTINFSILLPSIPCLMHYSQHFLKMPFFKMFFCKSLPWRAKPPAPALQPPDPQVTRLGPNAEKHDQTVASHGESRWISVWFQSPTSELADDLDRNCLYLNERINWHRHPTAFPSLNFF